MLSASVTAWAQRLPSAVRVVAWVVSSAVLILICGVATLHLLRMLLAAAGAGSFDLAELAFVGAYAMGAVGVLVVAWRVGPSLTSRTQALAALAAVALAAALRTILAMAFDAPLAAENAVIHEQAVGVLQGGNCCFSHRPMGYPLSLAAVYSFLGVSPVAIEVTNIALAAVTTVVVFDIARVGWSARAGVVAAVAYAVIPSQVLMALPPLTEPLYTAVVAVAIRIAMVGGFVAAAALGVALAAAQYVRSTAAALIAPVVALYVACASSLREFVAKGALTLVAFVVALAPVISFNLTQHGDVSISTSAYGGWSLFVGANQASSGRFNAEDSARFAQMPGESWWERSEYAGQLGVNRIAEDPLGFLALQPRKFAVLWRDESYAGSYAFSPAGSSVPPETRLAWLLSQLFYVPTIALASIGLIRHGRRHAPSLLIGMIVVVVTLTHAFLEVHSRYHAYLVPFLLILASGAVTRLHADATRMSHEPSPAREAQEM